MPAEQTVHLARYAPDAKTMVAAAQALADERKHAQVEPIHLLARAIERDPGVAAVFKKAGAEPAEIAAEVETQLARLPKSSNGLAYLSSAMLGLLSRAEKEATEPAPVGVEHLLNALSQEIRGAAAVVFQAFGLGPGSLRPHMAALTSVPRDVALSGLPAELSGGGGGSAQKYTRDLTEQARQGGFDPVIGRDVEVRRLLQILERRAKNHPLLVGDPGVGKTAIVSALAMRVAAGEVPNNLRNMQILELETGSLVAGARLRGEIEERLRQVLASTATSKVEDRLLYISGLDSLIGQGAAGNGVADFLKPLLARGEVRLLASTTPDGLRKMQERDPALLRRFTVLSLDPPTADQAIEILRGIATRYETHHQVQIGDPAVVSSVRLAKRYVQDRALPDSAVDLLDEAAARKRVEIDGVPAEVDAAIRRLSSLRAQMTALVGDLDPMSKKTMARLEKEIASLEPDVVTMKQKLESRRGALAALAALNEEEKRLETQLTEARASQTFAVIGEVEHVSLPDVRRRKKAAEEAVERVGGVGTANVVGEEDVARVLGDWTGIPIAKMLESEAEKLLKMEERLSARVDRAERRGACHRASGPSEPRRVA